MREWPYISVDTCQWYWDNAVPLPWSDVHLSNNWHLNLERILVPVVPTSGRARQREIQRRRAQLPPDLLHDQAFTLESPYWYTWFRDKHDARCRTAFLLMYPKCIHELCTIIVIF